jgi:hypothetical protein
MRFVASRRWKMTTQGPKNKGQCSSVGPAQPKGKLRPISFFALISNSRRRRRQPVPPVSAAPRYIRYRRRHRRFLGCINPMTEQTPATATSHDARYVHPSLNGLPSSPFSLRETSRLYFFDSSSPPPGTDAYQLAPGKVGHVALKSNTIHETQIHSLS